MTNHPKITFLLKDGTSKKVPAPVGHTIMEIAKNNDIEEMEALCGGCRACATCHILLPKKEYDLLEDDTITKKTEEEDCMLDLAFNVGSTSRLGCQVFMTKEMHEIQITMPQEG